MSIFPHRHSSRKIGADHPLSGKVVYIPTMGEGSPEAFAAAFRWLGVNAEPTPPSDERTRELGGKYTTGDECYPAKVTVGDFVRVIEQPGFDAERTAFFMPTAEGPCRFGQYAPFLRKILRDAGWGDVKVVSPTSRNGYVDLGDIANPFLRAAWRALVSADTIHRALLKTRPYETTPGAADRAFQESLADVVKTIENSCADAACQLDSLVESMTRARERFKRVPALYDRELPLIGVVGEIFCRLNTFSNEDLIRKLESYGAEACLSHISEWVEYTNNEQKRKLHLTGRNISLSMVKAYLRSHIQHADELALIAPFAEEFEGYEEPPIEEVLELAWPYLPTGGALGEMVLSVGKAAYLAKHGADGIIDISPFTCMNGIVTEAVYPKLSKAYAGIPIRNFYFDGTQADLDRDLGIYMELARSYREKKPFERRFPAYFGQAGALS
jgi:predicted nucleotide-binding protein (sugar kinase/HSP70/actin superfamily)